MPIASMEQEELAHRLEELRAQNDFHDVFAHALREDIAKTMKKIHQREGDLMMRPPRAPKKHHFLKDSPPPKGMAK